MAFICNFPACFSEMKSLWVGHIRTDLSNVGDSSVAVLRTGSRQEWGIHDAALQSEILEWCRHPHNTQPMPGHRGKLCARAAALLTLVLWKLVHLWHIVQGFYGVIWKKTPSCNSLLVYSHLQKLFLFLGQGETSCCRSWRTHQNQW